MRTAKKVLLIIPVMLCFVNMTCESDDDIDLSSDVCDQITLVNKAQYDNLVSDHFTIANAEISGDCLNIKIGASGCSGNSWEFSLVDSGAVAESSPEQRYLKLEFKNNEACLAVFSRTISFDLAPLRINNTSRKVLLNIDGLDTLLEYSY